MRYHLPSLAALFVASATACQPAAGPITAEDVAAIGNLRDQYAERTLAGDVAAVAAFYTEDAIEMPPDAPVIEGRSAIQANLGEGSAGLTAFTLTGLETEGRDGLAYDRGTYSVTVDVEGQSVSETGKFITVLTKQADGSWRLHRVIWNRDAPPPMPGG